LIILATRENKKGKEEFAQPDPSLRKGGLALS